MCCVISLLLGIAIVMSKLPILVKRFINTMKFLLLKRLSSDTVMKLLLVGVVITELVMIYLIYW